MTVDCHISSANHREGRFVEHGEQDDAGCVMVDLVSMTPPPPLDEPALVHFLRRNHRAYLLS